MNQAKSGMDNSYQVAVVGDWHLAFVTAGVLSYLGYKTLLVNHQGTDESKRWKEFPELPVYEPGLKEIFADARAKGLLNYSNDVAFNDAKNGWTADIVWMAIDTPVNDRDEADTTPLVAVAQKIAAGNKNHFLKAFITNSQIPIGFCSQLVREFKLPVVYIPENLRLGKGIETLYRADRTVIGAGTNELAQMVQTFLAGFQTEFVLCNLETAEMIKHANNAFLATSISFANELARIGEQFDVDGPTVAKALKLDKRIGAGAYVAPGLGFAGGTLPRDVRILQKMGTQFSIPMRIMDAVMAVNEDTTTAIKESVLKYLNKINSNQVLLLGYTYKADTDTLRRSLSIDLAKLLKEAGVQVYGNDPVMNEKDLSAITGLIQHIPDIYKDKAEEMRPGVVLLMTSRPAFKALDWEQLANKWKVPAIQTLVFDTQNFLDKDSLFKVGFSFKRMWSPLLTAQQSSRELRFGEKSGEIVR